MRRAANLFDQIPEPENLRLAFHKAARGRRGQAEVRRFAASLEPANRGHVGGDRRRNDSDRSIPAVLDSRSQRAGDHGPLLRRARCCIMRS